MMSKKRLLQPLCSLSGIFAVVYVLFPVITPNVFGSYADQRFIQVLLTGLLSATATVFVFRQQTISSSLVVRVFLPSLFLSFSFPLLSMPFTNHPYGLVEPGMYAFFFLTIILAGSGLAWSSSVRSYSFFLVNLVAGSCFFYGAMSINVYLFALFDGVKNMVDFIPWAFVNIRYWSHVATWFLPILPLAVLVSPLKDFRLWRIGVVLGGGLWWWIILMSTARGSLLGMAFGCLVVVMMFGRQALPWLRVFLMILLTGLMTWLLMSIVIPSFMADEVMIRSVKVDGSGRLPLFKEAWQMGLENFPFGMGAQSWLTHDVLTEAYSYSKRFGHPHNMYLMWAAEYGWSLIVLLALVAIQAIRYLWRRKAEVRAQSDREQALLLTGYTASVSAALFHAGVSSVFLAPGSMLVGLFILIAFWGLILPVPESMGQDQTLTEPPRKQKVVGLFLALAIVMVWAAWASEVWGYYRDMRRDELTYYDESGANTFPRFWFHGNYPR